MKKSNNYYNTIHIKTLDDLTQLQERYNKKYKLIDSSVKPSITIAKLTIDRYTFIIKNNVKYSAFKLLRSFINDSTNIKKHIAQTRSGRFVLSIPDENKPYKKVSLNVYIKIGKVSKTTDDVLL